MVLSSVGAGAMPLALCSYILGLLGVAQALFNNLPQIVLWLLILGPELYLGSTGEAQSLEMS